MKHLVKKLALIATLAWLPNLAFGALITTDFDQASYDENDTVLVDIVINNANTEMSWLDFDINFDDTLFMIEQFNFSQSVFNNSYYADAYDFWGAAPLTVSVEFIEGWYHNLGGSFVLGQASFYSLADSQAYASLGYLAVTDALGNTIPSQGVQTVPEPMTISLILIGLLIILGRKKLANTV
ncbi:PEP-CTERM sorting domain-containing protein [Thalassotalea sp. PLHSN55]|uniref:PEP-CTERM sorting domain-containing protein n=1 Tax=Thalassotalea sp. PLHSN55 TaxID=3435888 RepID=UPI003F82772C